MFEAIDLKIGAEHEAPVIIKPWTGSCPTQLCTMTTCITTSSIKC